MSRCGHDEPQRLEKRMRRSTREGTHMISMEMAKSYPSVKTLVEDGIPGRVHVKDATLYSFSEEARECAANFMGWADLASNPPCAVADIQSLANMFIQRGMKLAVLIGQGGSTQAAMTMTKYNRPDSNGMQFRVLDSDSPVRLRKILAEADPRTTVVVVSSKSGGTLEMRSYLNAVREAFGSVLDPDELAQHLVAITDPGSALATQAQEEGWAGLLYGEPTVGGRFSALSVFGLFPAALTGIDLESLIARAREAEFACCKNNEDNPAVHLAAFLYENWLAGRDKFAYVTQKRGRVLGLWIEQLVAESVGKQGVGILPQIETDTLLLRRDLGDRAVVTYRTRVNAWDDASEFQRALDCISPDLPRVDFELDDVGDLAEHFILWEYATAMCGYLMQVCPFDQPDVASAKAKVLEILEGGLPEPDAVEEFSLGSIEGVVEMRLSDCCARATDIHSALYGLIESLRLGDYFAINAFLPFTGEGRREALESMRHQVAAKCKIMSCLEIGPRYLHSTGQLQKGGPNRSVFLILSADEARDIPLVGEKAESLGQLAKAQAIGDYSTLVERGRRCLHLHLPDNSGVTLRYLSNILARVLDELR